MIYLKKVHVEMNGKLVCSKKKKMAMTVSQMLLELSRIKRTTTSNLFCVFCHNIRIYNQAERTRVLSFFFFRWVVLGGKY